MSSQRQLMPGPLETEWSQEAVLLGLEEAEDNEGVCFAGTSRREEEEMPAASHPRGSPPADRAELFAGDAADYFDPVFDDMMRDSPPPSRVVGGSGGRGVVAVSPSPPPHRLLGPSNVVVDAFTSADRPVSFNPVLDRSFLKRFLHTREMSVAEAARTLEMDPRFVAEVRNNVLAVLYRFESPAFPEPEPEASFAEILAGLDNQIASGQQGQQNQQSQQPTRQSRRLQQLRQAKEQHSQEKQTNIQSQGQPLRLSGIIPLGLFEQEEHWQASQHYAPLPTSQTPQGGMTVDPLTLTGSVAPATSWPTRHNCSQGNWPRKEAFGFRRFGNQGDRRREEVRIEGIYRPLSAAAGNEHLSVFEGSLDAGHAGASDESRLFIHDVHRLFGAELHSVPSATQLHGIDSAYAVHRRRKRQEAERKRQHVAAEKKKLEEEAAEEQKQHDDELWDEFIVADNGKQAEEEDAAAEG